MLEAGTWQKLKSPTKRPPRGRRLPSEEMTIVPRASRAGLSATRLNCVTLVHFALVAFASLGGVSQLFTRTLAGGTSPEPLATLEDLPGGGGRKD